MDRKNYSYPNTVRITKFYCKLLIPFLTIITVIVWFTTDPGEYRSQVEYLALLVTIPLFPLFVFWFLYSWSDIGIDNDGLWIEFFGRYIFVPWDDIAGIKFVGSKNFGVWLITTSEHNLTFFHRSYSFFYSRSYQPGIVIHPQIKSVSELISEIRKNTTRQS